MEKTYLFDIADSLSFIREQVRPYLGRGADFINVTDALGATVDIVIYDRLVNHRSSPTVQLTDLGVPTDVARNTIDEICSTLHLMFCRFLGPINPAFIYEYDVNELTGTLTLMEKERRVVPIPAPNVDVVTQYRLQMQQVLEDGGWVPETVRRNLGL